MEGDQAFFEILEDLTIIISNFIDHFFCARHLFSHFIFTMTLGASYCYYSSILILQMVKPVCDETELSSMRFVKPSRGRAGI